MSVPPVPIETLLAHRAWVRGLARSLVRDEARADDLEQQAWLAAIERPPAREDSPRGWLATVLRRAAGKERRTEFRRGGRERAVARSDALPAADDLAAHAETLERVVKAVLDLEEPYRAVVLLRFFEGIEAVEIARRTSTPLDTVRSRLRRALERLRERFDREHGGRRGAWVALLLPLAASPEGPGGPSGGGAAPAAVRGAFAMSAKSAAAAVLVALLAAGLFLLRGPGKAGGGAAPPAAVEAPVPVETAKAAPPAPPPPPPSAPLPPPPAPPPGCRVRLRLLEEDGSPVPAEEARRILAGGTRVQLVRSSALARQGLEAYLTTGMGLTDDWRRGMAIAFDEGGPYLDPPASEGTWRVFVSAPGRPPRLGEEIPVPATGDAVAEIRLPAPAATLRIRATDADTRSPLAGATVTPYYELGDDQVFLAGMAVLTDAAGEADLPQPADEPLARRPSWWITAPGRAAPVVDGRAPAQRTGPLEVAVPATARIEGQAFLASGTPAAGCTVITGRKGLALRTRVDAEGRFVLEGIPAAGMYARWAVFLVESDSPLRVASQEVQVQPGKTVEVRFGEAYLAGTRAILQGRITAGGNPMPGVSILVRAGDPRKKDGPARMGTTDADGRYRVEGIPEGDASVFVWTGGLGDNWGVRSPAPRRFTAGEEVTGDFDLPGGALRIRVLDAGTGKPVKGAGAGASPADRTVENGRFPGWTFSPGQAAYAGEDGTVLLVGLPPGVPHRLEVMARGYRKAQLPAEGATPAEGVPVPEIVVRLEPAGR